VIALRDGAVTFKWKDYRREGRDRQKTMTLPIAEFIRRFLIHVLPSGFHRIRHYGLLASGARARNIARGRQLLTPAEQSNPNEAAERLEMGIIDLKEETPSGELVWLESARTVPISGTII